MTPRVRELTPRGTGAVTVLEVSGPGAVEHLRILAGAREFAPGMPTLVRLAVDGDTLDEALVLAEGPERCEIHLHGSPAVVAAVGAALGGWDDPAPPRTLEQAAWRELESAAGVAAARILLDQAEGALGRALKALAYEPAESAAAGVRDLIEAGRRAAFALRPVTVILAGPVNAGKSTLFNALVGEERALVHGEAGTTRDAIGEGACLGGWPVTLVDTAGARDLGEGGAPAAGPATVAAGAAAEVELAGQERARALAAGADLVLWCRPPEGPPAPSELAVGGVLTLRTRCDPPAVPRAGVAALEKPEEARREVARLFRAHFDLPERAWALGAPVPFLPGHLEALVGWLEAPGGWRPEALVGLLGV